MEEAYYRVRLRGKGQVTLPSEVREKLAIKEGDDVVFYIDETGRVILDKVQIIPPDQAWFWSERWQNMEREVQADIDAGRVQRYPNVDEALKDLEASLNADDRDSGVIS